MESIVITPKITLGKSVWRLVDNSLFSSVYTEVYHPFSVDVNN